MTSAQPPSFPDLIKIASASLHLTHSQAQMQTQYHPGFLPTGSPRLSLVEASPHLHLQKSCPQPRGSFPCFPHPRAHQSLLRSSCPGSDTGVPMRFICTCGCFLCNCRLPKGKSQVTILSPAWCTGHRCLPPCTSPREPW